jgi:hypothetical protein
VRTKTGYVLSLIAAAGAAAVLSAPAASAQPNPDLPTCESTAGGEFTGTGVTQCASPGNVQIDATAPAAPVYAYPWDDEFYGSALIMGGGEGGFHGGGGGGGGGGRR